MSLRDFQANGSNFEITEEMKDEFNKSGLLLLRGLFDEEEVEKIQSAMQGTEIKSNTYKVADKGKGQTRVCLWTVAGDDLPGLVARCDKMAGTSEKLLGGEVYHYYTKLMMKEPHEGGEILWHQDYGYWYKNGNLFPDMVTAFVAVDRCSKENGCLQALLGSHRCGRIDHDFVDSECQFQLTVDEDRVHEIAKRCPHVYLEMNPGDVAFFHCNFLHCSDANAGDLRRWAFLVVYNKASNDPYKVHHYPNYSPLVKVPNSAIKDCHKMWDVIDKDMLSDRLQEKAKMAGEEMEGKRNAGNAIKHILRSN